MEPPLSPPCTIQPSFVFVIIRPKGSGSTTTLATISEKIHNMPFQLRYNTSNLERQLFGFLIVFVILFIPWQQNGSSVPSTPISSAKDASIRFVVDASSHGANVFITVAAIIYTGTTLKMT
jgi:hypothetical protein